MKEISQKEFENSIRSVIDGKCTRADLQRKYHVDRVTLNNKIQELYVYNQELYLEFIAKFPYRPRTYTHINYRAMVIDIMKRAYNKKQAAEQYGIHNRTISRKIQELEKSEPELIALYREVSRYRKARKPLPMALKKEVDELAEEEIFIGAICDAREKELMEKEKQYVATRMEGISDTKAYGNRRTIKDLSTLYRIEIEKRVGTEENEPQRQTKREQHGEERE